ncbi:MAG TPA: hypothetical protein VFN18_02005 [Solirubrobacterales bacterium]|nr:hypothetical protein [Solirubrobacterales bacterium]
MFLGDVLALAEDLREEPAEKLARGLPEHLLGLPEDVPIAGLGSDRVEEAALLWRRIISERWFDDYSREVGAASMRLVLDPEAELSWPDAVLSEMERAGEALEWEAVSEADLRDWVGSWFARAKRREELRP